MLDIKFIKENKDLVAEAIKNKKRDVDLDELLRLSEERKVLHLKIDTLNQARNEAARTRDVESGTKLKKEAEGLEEDFKKIEKDYISMMLKVPNIYSPDTPIGEDESSNKVLREWGNKPKFDFKPKEHFEIGEALGIIDTETATEISGPRFAYLKGDLALLQFALVQFCFEILTNKEKLEKIAQDAGLSIAVTPFTPVIPPVFVKSAVQNRMARFLTPEEHYMFPEDGTMLIGSAEHTLGPIYMDKVLEEKDLPIRLAGYSPAFRREAGSYGKDMKGILRVHQFDKIEMETFCLPENSLQEQNFLVAIQEHLVQSLGLAYRVMILCTGDMGFPNYRQIDLEIWMPGQDRYRETHSADLTSSFQSRRLNTRVKRTDKKIENLHMNDATFCAMGRMLIAIIENYQQADGSVKIPDALVPYMNGKTEIKK